MQRTIHTRLTLTAAQSDLLTQYAQLFGRVERTLFAETLAKGRVAESVKNDYLRRFGLTSRQFNAIARPLKGKVKSIIERHTGLIKDNQARISTATKAIKSLQRKLDLAQRQKNPIQTKIERLKLALHGKKRRLAILEHRHAKLKSDAEQGIVRLCFGSRKLFQAQFNLSDNGYSSFEEWKVDWDLARSRQFYVLGSKDETAGCQSCVIRLNELQHGTLQLRLPVAMETSCGKSLTLPIRLPRGSELIRAALQSGQAINYRFLRDEKGWRVFVTTEVSPVNIISRRTLGAFAIDINEDHLALAETDRHGNLMKTCNIPLNLYGSSREQAQAIIGDAVKVAISMVASQGKPMVLENLDFRKKKAQLEACSPRRARQLSSFAYQSILNTLRSRCHDQGVEVIPVNPAYSSVIGLWKFAGRYGITTHQSAALVLARRGLEFSERPNRRDHTAARLPVRKNGAHRWSYWSQVARQKAVFATLHVRCRKTLSPACSDRLGDPGNRVPVCPSKGTQAENTVRSATRHKMPQK